MDRDRHSGAGNFVAGAVIGGAVGALLALLFAPQSGEETRKLVKKKAQEVGKDIKEMKDEIGPKFEQAKKDLSKKFAKAKK